MDHRQMRRRRWPLYLTAFAVSIAVALLYFLAFIWLRPVPAPQPDDVRPIAPASFEAAIASAAALGAIASEPVNPLCETKLLHHNAPTAKVAILLHGYTNCPAQFDALAQRLHASGYTVFVPRLPQHGLADRLTDALSSLRAEDLMTTAEEAVNIAQALGDEVIVLGLSGGGTMAAWIAQNRADIDRAVIIAPLIDIRQIPPQLEKPFTNLALTVPNLSIWWDGQYKAASPDSPPYAYPRYSTRAIGEILRLGHATSRQAARRGPTAGEIVVVTNDADGAISNEAVDKFLVRPWQDRGARVATYRFPGALGLDHDIISPEHPGARVDVVYPQLERFVAGEGAPP